MTGKEAAGVLSSVVKGLQNQPLLLALVVINAMIGGFAFYLFRSIHAAEGARMETQKELFKMLMEKCN
jgi:hypothetical protein